MNDNNETINVPMPSRLTVLVYKSEVTSDWVSHVTLHADDVETDAKDAYFGSEWRSPEKPSRKQIREHIVDMLDHEVRHQLNLDPHAVGK